MSDEHRHDCGSLFGCGEEQGLSIAGNFGVTQVVDIVRGVHAMIPKSLFAADFQPQITVV